jgi:hypothetical protein
MEDHKMSRDYFIEHYGDQYLDQMNQLEKQITELETGKRKIIAKGIEAGLGNQLRLTELL